VDNDSADADGVGETEDPDLSQKQPDKSTAAIKQMLVLRIRFM
jgi:hypothetical protein